MARYRVLQPWFGVKRNDIVELKTLNPAIAAQVELVPEEAKESSEGDDGKGKSKGKLTVNPEGAKSESESAPPEGAKK